MLRCIRRARYRPCRLPPSPDLIGRAGMISRCRPTSSRDRVHNGGFAPHDAVPRDRDAGRVTTCDKIGAGEGNRTLVVSLGSFCSTIELHPHFNCLALKWPWAIPVCGSGSSWARQALPRASSCRQHAWCASSAICRRARLPAARTAPHATAPEAYRRRLTEGRGRPPDHRADRRAAVRRRREGRGRTRPPADRHVLCPAQPLDASGDRRAPRSHPQDRHHRRIGRGASPTGRSRGRSTTPGRPRWSRRGDAATPGRGRRVFLIARRLSVRSGNLIRAAMRAGRGRGRSPR